MGTDIETIKKLANDVYEELGSGYPEVVYDRAMQVGLRLANIKYEGQKVVEVKYRGHYVGEGYPDMIVHFDKGNLAIELKAITGKLGIAESKQLENYMKILKIKKGLLINFPQPGSKETRIEPEFVELG